MSKTALIFLILAGLSVWIWTHKDDKLIASMLSSTKSSVAKSDYVEIIDQHGRALSCKITAKRTPFIQIEREADGRKFVMSLATLDTTSARKLNDLADFNGRAMDAELYILAKRELKAELLWAPALSTFRCQYTGQTMKSSEGMETDACRAYLRTAGISFREVALTLKKSPDGGFYYPPGITSSPCFRIGEKIIYGRNVSAIRTALIDHYIDLSVSANL